MSSERCVLLLAGGSSTRLGRDKRLTHVGGQPLFARTAAMARSIGWPVFAAVTAADLSLPSAPEVAVLAEPPPQGGALRAVAFWLRRFDAELLLLAADLPLLTAQGLQPLLDAAARDAACLAVVARTPGGLEPLCAVVRPGLTDALEAALARGEQSLSRTLACLPPHQLRCVDLAEELLFNVNDAQQLAAARARATV